MYEKYKKLIELKIERKELTQEFVDKTIIQLDYYLAKNKLSKEEHDELITLLNLN